MKGLHLSPETSVCWLILDFRALFALAIFSLKMISILLKKERGREGAKRTNMILLKTNRIFLIMRDKNHYEIAIPIIMY